MNEIVVLTYIDNYNLKDLSRYLSYYSNYYLIIRYKNFNN